MTRANPLPAFLSDVLPKTAGEIPADRPILIAGATASGKSDLALRIADTIGGVIVNADASQVYACWQIVTARPDAADLARAPHALYGHVPCDAAYSAGAWLRDVRPLLDGGQRPIIVGGTGLYFRMLTHGMAPVPPVPADIRARGDALALEALIAGIDEATRAGIDTANRARVQRAWEVQTATGLGLAHWQAQTPPPVLALENTLPLVVDIPKDRLEARIRSRFDRMLAAGALDEVRAMLDRYDPALPAHRAIGVPELVAHLRGELTLSQATEAASIATRQFAKRQRTWFRSKMADWHRVPSPG
ncbi:MAG: tRNA (adenosine(37)-N6)-dimethylallyltransferase MiaA [Marinibacterium sp.]